MFNNKNYNFYIYILSNHERNCLYVGFCNDIARRIIEHMHGLGCDYSKKYKTVDLLYYEHYQYVNEAIAREKQIKRWGRDKKIALIKKINPELKTINQELFNDCLLSEKDVFEITNILKEKYSINN